MLISIIPIRSPDMFPGIDKIDIKETKTPTFVNLFFILEQSSNCAGFKSL